jgi:hypothetical protein
MSQRRFRITKCCVLSADVSTHLLVHILHVFNVVLDFQVCAPSAIVHQLHDGHVLLFQRCKAILALYVCQIVPPVAQQNREKDSNARLLRLFVPYTNTRPGCLAPSATRKLGLKAHKNSVLVLLEPWKVGQPNQPRCSCLKSGRERNEQLQEFKIKMHCHKQHAQLLCGQHI